MWSPKLLRACSLLDMGMGIFPVSFTDAWTICLEHELWRNHQVDITRFTQGIAINRTTCEVDQPGNERWDTDRKTNFEFIKSEAFRSAVREQARRVECQL